MKVLNEKDYKDLVFEMLFEERVVRHKRPVNGKHVDFTMVCTNKSLSKFFNGLFSRKYQSKMKKADYMSHVMYNTHLAIQRFHIRDEGTWEQLIDDMKNGVSNKNLGQLINNIKNTVENELIRTGDIEFSSTMVDGEKYHTATSIQFSSLDMVLIDSDGNETALVEMIGNDSNFFGVKGEYHKDSFITWFLKEKERILTKSQLQLLNNLQKVGYGEGNTIPTDELQQVTGFAPKRIKEYLTRIKNRVVKAWEKEKATEEKTELQKQKEAELALWVELYEIMASDDLENQNKHISDWFVRNINNTYVMNLVYDNIIGDDIRDVVKAINNENHHIKSSILYQLIELVEQRLDYLQTVNTSKVKFYKKPEEMGRWTPEAHAEANRKRQEFIQEQPIEIRKLNPDGTVSDVIRVEQPKKNNKKKTLIYEIDAFGNKNEIKDELDY